VAVDVGVEIQARLQKHGEGADASLVQSEAVLCEHTVMQQAFEIDGPDRDTTHIRITQHVIEIICSIHAAQHWLEIAQPARHLAVVRGLLLHDVGHIRWLQYFV
jgi:hypothetical protein